MSGPIEKKNRFPEILARAPHNSLNTGTGGLVYAPKLYNLRLPADLFRPSALGGTKKREFAVFRIIPRLASKGRQGAGVGIASLVSAGTTIWKWCFIVVDKS
jgi:hypothetical protein